MATVIPANSEAYIRPIDRLSFTVFLAIASHAAIIFGITFTYAAKQPSSHTMEITLAQQRSKNKPVEPDFLAQIDQTGSGTSEEKQMLMSTNEARFHDTKIQKSSRVLTQQSLTRERRESPIIATNLSSDKRIYQEKSVDGKKREYRKAVSENSLANRAIEIASLQAKLDRQQQIFSKRPRIKRLTSISTASSPDAYYLNSWRRKIENIGNLNYPAEARKRKLYGSLRLMVAIAPDGSLEKVELLESSGHTTLDDAAIRIVKLAAPFAPFPDELRKNTDLLEIIRTWQFRKNSSLRSY